MSNVYKITPHRENERADQASQWIAKLDRGLTESELEALHTWIEVDSKNKIELQSQAALWDKMDALSRLSELFPRTAVAPAVEPNLSARWAGLAAAIVVSVFAGILLVNLGEEFPTEVTAYETAIGGRSVIDLADGSILTLNTKSRVEVLFKERHRDIELKYGEIHIDVAHDPARPLRVFAGDRVVQAVGTAFSVKIDASQRVEILVADGRVRIGVQSQYDRGYNDPALGDGDVIDRKPILAAEGERIILDAEDESLEVLEPDEIEVRLSWRKGNLVFRGESLRNAVAEVGRYTSVEFVFLDEDLKKLRVAGLFKAGDVSGFLSTLEANFDIAHRRVDDQTILLSANTSLNEDGDN